MKLLLILFAAWRAYRSAGDNGSSYVGLTSHGVPQICVFLGTGREAWRVSQRAFEECELRRAR